MLPRCLRLVLLGVLVGLPFTSPRAQAQERDVPDAAEFARAPRDFGPVPIWWWSGEKLERERLYWQLERFSEGHIYNVIVLNLAPSGPLFGSDADDPPFFSEAWWAIFEDVLERAKELGIRIWFYDQIGFSGASIQSRLVTEHPELRGTELRVHRQRVSGPARFEWDIPKGAQILSAHTGMPAGPSKDRPSWIWHAGGSGIERCYFRREIDLAAAPEEASLVITADNGYRAFINGIEVGQDGGAETAVWQRAERYSVDRLLRAGRNVLAIEAENLGGPAGLLLELELTTSGRGVQRIVSDDSFLSSSEASEGWTEPRAGRETVWQPARVVGPVGVEPWGAAIAGLMEYELEVAMTDPRAAPFSTSGSTLSIEVPAGDREVLVFYTVPGGFDYLDPAAGAALLDAIHGELERRVGEHLGKTLAGGFQDELPAMPHWSERVPAEFEQRKGYSLLEHLPALALWLGEESERVRSDLSDVLSGLAEESFFEPTFRWHERFGIFTGFDQVARRADPIRAQQWYLDYFRTHRWYGAPGNDMDGDTRPHSSIAHLYERPRVWIEGYHSSGWGQTLEDIAHLLHAHYRQGATLYNPHAVYYSTRGGWWEWAPPSTGWRQPYWSQYARFADYVARLSYLLSQGHHVTDVGVLYPSRTVQAHTSLSGPDVLALRARETFWSVMESVRRIGRDADLIDEDSLERGTVSPRGLEIGGETYPHLVLPAVTTLQDRSLERLGELARAGTRISYIGEPSAPLRARAAERGADPADWRSFAEAEDWIRSFESEVPPDVDGPVEALHRRIGDLDVYFLVADTETRADSGARFQVATRDLHALAEKTRRLKVSFRCSGEPELWDAWTGEILPLHSYRRSGGRTEVTVDFTRAPAALVAFRSEGWRPELITSDLDQIESIEARGDGYLVRGTVRQGGRLHVELQRGSRRFRGEAVAPEASEPWDLGQVYDCEVVSTLDNSQGDLAWPPAQKLPVEVRQIEYRSEVDGEDGREEGWERAPRGESDWTRVTATFGPKAEKIGPLDLSDAEALVARLALGEETKDWKVEPVVFSASRGIEEDPIHRSSLGPKGHVPHEFIDVGALHPGQAVLITSSLRIEGAESPWIHVGAAADKEVWLEGEPVILGSGRHISAPVSLEEGWIRIVLVLANPSPRVLPGRAYVYLTNGPESDPRPLWIGAERPGDGFFAFAEWQLESEPRSARVAIAYDAACQVLVNGEVAADLGRYDAYFMSRSQYVDLRPFLREGENLVGVRMETSSREAGFMLDGAAHLSDGTRSHLISGDGWQVVPLSGAGVDPPAEHLATASAARLLRGPSRRFIGDLSSLFLRPRPHPLRGASWMEDEGNRRRTREEILPVSWEPDPRRGHRVGWYRFRLPPGAVELEAKIAGEVEAYCGEQLSPKTGEEDWIHFDLPQPQDLERWMVLRIEQEAGYEGGAAFLAPPRLRFTRGRIELGDWREQGLASFSGRVTYEAQIDGRPEGGSVVLSLGRVRGVVEVEVNGRSAGVRLWHPYELEIAPLLHEGRNRIRIHVDNTLGPHYDIGNPSSYVFEGQTVSGLFGPVQLIPRRRVEVNARAMDEGR